jgi:DNA-binding PadR family transcriptional regulator
MTHTLPGMAAEDLIPLNPRDYLILFSLAGGERHGYGIVKDVEHDSDGRVRIDPANLYRSIKRMIATGLVEDGGDRTTSDAGDERRRYYRITALGVEVVSLEAARLAALTAAARERDLLPGRDGSR